MRLGLRVAPVQFGTPEVAPWPAQHRVAQGGPACHRVAPCSSQCGTPSGHSQGALPGGTPRGALPGGTSARASRTWPSRAIRSCARRLCARRTASCAPAARVSRRRRWHPLLGVGRARHGDGAGAKDAAGARGGACGGGCLHANSGTSLLYTLQL